MPTDVGGEFSEIKISENCKLAACRRGQSLFIFNLDQRSLVKSISSENGFVADFTFSRDSQFIFLSHLNSTEVIRTSDFSLKMILSIGSSFMSCSPDSKTVAFESGGLEFWSLVDGRKKFSIPGGNKFHFRGDWGAVAVSKRSSVDIYSTENGQLLGKIDGQADRVNFMPDNSLALERPNGNQNSYVEIYGLNASLDNYGAQILATVCPSGSDSGLGHGAPCLMFIDGGVPVDIQSITEITRKSYSSIAECLHPGFEIRAPVGAPVFAPLDGRVVDEIVSTSDPDYAMLGYSIIIQHPATNRRPESYSLFCHQAVRPIFPLGEQVYAGRTIVCNSAGENAPVHFEIRRFSSRFFDSSRTLVLKQETQLGSNGLERLKAHWLAPSEIFNR